MSEMTALERKKLCEEFRFWMEIKYPNIPIEDTCPSNTPGYWHIKGQIGTIYIANHGARDERGRFISPFRIWRACREAAGRRRPTDSVLDETKTIKRGE